MGHSNTIQWTVIMVAFFSAMPSEAKAAEPPSRATMRFTAEIAPTAGGIFGLGMRRFASAFGAGFTTAFVWERASDVSFGLRLSAAFTNIPYGNSDGEWSLGRGPDYDPNQQLTNRNTAVTSWMFVTRIRPMTRFFLDVMVGLGNIVPFERPQLLLLPFPTGGIGLGVSILTTRSLSINLFVQQFVSYQIMLGGPVLALQGGVGFQF